MTDYQHPQPYAAPQAYPQAYAPAVDPNYVAQLEQRVRYLEAKCATALVSGGFFKKAFAVWGYSFVASFIIGMIVSILSLILSLVFGAAVLGSLGSFLQQQGTSGPF
jgi:uncharacterized membrane protein